MHCNLPVDFYFYCALFKPPKHALIIDNNVNTMLKYYVVISLGFVKPVG